MCKGVYKSLELSFLCTRGKIWLIACFCVAFALLTWFLAGKKELPDVKVVVEKFLLRRKFVPDPQRTSLMFAFFAQHFTHQFFKTDMKRGPAFTKGKNHGVSLNPSVATFLTVLFDVTDVFHFISCHVIIEPLNHWIYIFSNCYNVHSLGWS